MTSTWLPVAEKYANAWMKNLPHFEHRVTSRIASSHAYIKSYLSGPNYFFPAVIKSITTAVVAQAHEISVYYHQQRINALHSLGAVFSNCHGRITHFALRKAQNNLISSADLDKPLRRNGNHQLRTGISCEHRIAELTKRGEKVESDEFHAQWHIKDFRLLDQPKSADDVQKVEQIKEKLLEMNPTQRAKGLG
ncbi:hypothetical protein PSTG_02750 [Puccinia striiformis f. sp. tritici PST-78]|uniref:Uncharacterized protein n=1 Tax=Puccinia striiformis f. sp. tritici PST-78 TaxID=1165861 RepID=A0A0L0VXY4_9BASI|nr:hypothetical protein PSTG_02750 [Puccinia striiformis f. sp. tritici PST-78]